MPLRGYLQLKHCLPPEIVTDIVINTRRHRGIYPDATLVRSR